MIGCRTNVKHLDELRQTNALLGSMEDMVSVVRDTPAPFGDLCVVTAQTLFAYGHTASAWLPSSRIDEPFELVARFGSWDVLKSNLTRMPLIGVRLGSADAMRFTGDDLPVLKAAGRVVVAEIIRTSKVFVPVLAMTECTVET